ncbi:hypothetical protein PoB_003619300 [Plakobranchus ocellatus]|uniref:Uncharacterized protein n=1 Tax=Plakobranchus ocellatus TaxID=259542 RepID=A0AAV4ASZ2_9GAST|nr:hypothetical protein PoB_003619300 [Plakobranchus ocellatus]
MGKTKEVYEKRKGGGRVNGRGRQGRRSGDRVREEAEMRVVLGLEERKKGDAERGIVEGVGERKKETDVALRARGERLQRKVFGRTCNKP